MSDVLGYLSEVVHRVSATFMPTEMDDVASFLRGDAWVLVSAPNSQRSRGSSSTAEKVAVTNSNHPIAAAATTTAAATAVAPVTQLRYPLGATRWDHFIPLGIADTALVSAATADSRAVLMGFFESSGFSQVFTVNLMPSEQQLNGSLHRGLCGAAADFATTASALPSAQRSAGSRVGADRTTASRKRQRLSNATATAAAGEGASSPHVVDVALDGRYGTTAQAARHACMAAVRRWFEEVERTLKEEEGMEEEEVEGGDASVAGGQAAPQPAWFQLRRQGPRDTQPSTPSDAAAAAPPTRKTQLRRLLILVRCCADNRVAVSTRAGGGGGGAPALAVGGAPSASTGVSGRRPHRRGDDPLLLFLHDLAALTTLYEARLAASVCSVRPAVLLLPEDESYGGALLKQRLTEEVGYRYWVQLFVQTDAADSQQHAQGGGGAAASESVGASGRLKSGVGEAWTASLVGPSAAHRNGTPPQLHRQGEAPLLRGCRLAALWGVLDTSVVSTDVAEGGVSAVSPRPSLKAPASSDGSGGSPSTPAWVDASVSQLEAALRRHSACFFARPSNAPLCVFLMEALRRFPLLAPPAMLQHWQSTWTARHALSDVLCVFHATVCPFTVSAAQQQDASPPNTPGDDVGAPASSLHSHPHSSPSSLLRDATDLLDALLDAAFILAEERDSIHPLSSNDFHVEQAILFMLMYEALVQQREARLRRMPGVVDVLVRLHDRQACSSSAAGSCGSYADTAENPTTDAKVRNAVRHLLPFAPLNVFYTAVARCSGALPARTASGHQSSSPPPPPPPQQQQLSSAKREVKAYPMNSLVLPLRRMSVAPQLQSTTLLSLLPPEASLLELRGVAERLWARELPERWRHLGQTLACCSGSPPHPGASTPTPAQLSAENFYHPLLPHAVRVLYLLTAHALSAPTEVAKQVPVVQLQQVCQLSDEQLLLVLQELQMTGLVSTNLTTQTARTLLDLV
jgi:hypothetical protein